MRLDQVLRRAIFFTEKANALGGINQYVFEVHPDANKVQIRHAIKSFLHVIPRQVNTMVVRAKERRIGAKRAKMKNWKKAIVTLSNDQKIDLTHFGHEGGH